MTDLQPKRIAITGGGSGLGREIALRYARDGWRVAIADIDGARARQVAAEIDDAGGEGLGTTADTRNPDDLARFCEQCIDRWGGVDVFVNNAGVAGSGTVTDTDLDAWHWMIDINLMGMVHGTRAALPLLRESKGHLVNIASFAAIASAPGMAAYNVSKAGVVSLSESVRGEELDNGVGVTVVCPAFFATNLLDSFRGNDQQRATVDKLMAKSEVVAADVADDICRAVRDNRFMVISHRTSRHQYWLKRLAPERFFLRGSQGHALETWAVERLWSFSPSFPLQKTSIQGGNPWVVAAKRRGFPLPRG